MAHCGDGCLDGHRQACVHKDGAFAFVYLTSGGTESVDLCKLSGDTLNVWWFNPRNGECSQAVQIANNHTWEAFTAPDEGRAKDWILVIDDACAGFGRPGRLLSEVKAMYEAPETAEEKVFPDWDE